MGNYFVNGGGRFLNAKEPFAGTGNITYTFKSIMLGFDIINDGSSDLTFTINGQPWTVKAGELWSDTLEPYTTVTITANGPFRANGRG